jgi:hypothetical protein
VFHGFVHGCVDLALADAVATGMGFRFACIRCMPAKAFRRVASSGTIPAVNAVMKICWFSWSWRPRRFSRQRLSLSWRSLTL